MRAAIFVGPTLAADRVRDILDAEVLPPVGQGDVYRIARKRPQAIGIIDGYFEGVPSVWHKEILWALDRGIPVFGSASMGALRAAELADFGMIGVGRIFEAYRAGAIKDDDEVAVLHGPGELGYTPLSEPMVSIRATVERARAEGIVAPEVADQLVGIAKALNYRDRQWPAILERLDVALKNGFAQWLPQGRVDAKADDAREMLNAMSRHLAEKRDPPKLAHGLEPTLVWQGLKQRIDTEVAKTSHPAEQILDELRLDPARFALIRDRAMLRMLTQEPVRAQTEVDRKRLVDTMSRHRRHQGLSRKEHLLDWLQQNDLEESGYEALVTESARIDAIAETNFDRLGRYVLNELHWSGDYPALKKRALAKARLVPPRGSSASPDRMRLMIWYFETVLGQTIPDNLDSHIQSLGLTNRDAFHAIVEREFQYRTRLKDEGPAGAQTKD